MRVVSVAAPTLAPVTDNASTPGLSDEDAFVFPDAWKRFIRPRRGEARTRKFTPKPDAAAEFRKEREARVRKYLEDDANPGFEAHVNAFLGGEPDLLGAAAAMLLARPSHGPVFDRLAFDAAAAEHGLPFAVAALAESFTLDSDHSWTAAHERYEIVRRDPSGAAWWRFDRCEKVPAVRKLLVTLPDGDYLAVVTALAVRRGDFMHRLAVSLLVPSEREWLEEVCSEFRAAGVHPSCSGVLLHVVHTPEQLAAIDHAGLSVIGRAAEVGDVLHRLGPDALPVLERRLTSGYWVENLFRALAAIPTDHAFGLLLDKLDEFKEPVAMDYVKEAASRFPQRALRLIAARAAGAEPEARERYTVLLNTADPILLATLPFQDTAVREAIEGLLPSGDRVPCAPDDEIPPLLLDPPWLGDGSREPLALTGMKAPAILKLRWAEGERERWSRAGADDPDVDVEVEVAKFRSVMAGETPFDPPWWWSAGRIAAAPVPLAAALFEVWETEGVRADPSALLAILASLGEEALEKIATVEPSSVDHAGLLPIVSLDNARQAADAFAHKKTLRKFATEWFDRHREDAAVLLIPDALGKAKKRRSAAETALRYVASEYGSPSVCEAAATYGPEAAEAIAALVDVDPLMPVGVKVPEIGPWVSAPLFPQVLLAGGRALPDAAIRNLATVLALGTPEHPYAGVDAVGAACDHESLQRFSLALFHKWDEAGAPSQDTWALSQLAHFGGDAAVELLAPLVGRWPGENRHHHAVLGLKTLGAIGSEAALRMMNRIAERARFSAIKEEAGEQIESIAKGLGLTAEQLTDRLVPDFGLGEESSLVLDYGPRQFRVGLDESLQPFVTDENGKIRKALPKPGAKDDTEQAEASYYRFSLLRKELRAVASDQMQRLERAMIATRTWTLEEFGEHFVHHPLMRHLTRRLLWTADSVAFRVAEDGSFADANEDPLTPSAGAVVRLAHPVHLGGEVERWAEVFADYQIVQPFPQIARPVGAFTEEERRTGRLPRFEGQTAPVGALLGLSSKGWERSAPMDAGFQSELWFSFPEGGGVELRLDPGIMIGDVEAWGHQDIRAAVLSGPVDAVTASEAITSLEKALE